MKELRADARRNREQILRAAHLAFLEHGPDAPLDQIAERAGVGNATLYRHFPTRTDLIQSVVLDDMAQVAALATETLAGAPSAGDALTAFATGVVERRIVAMLPILGGHVEPSPEFHAVRTRVLTALDALVAAARAEGALRPDVSATDLVLFLTVLTRPLPTMSGELGDAVRARMLATLLDGLRPAATTGPLPGLPLTADRITADLSRRPDA
ncbi:AcrR family transcriptional regulator [Thermocatellispora tengchongensis]|uniref:AcrR family transcriptional regulator n=1 Tax=Thermocatellispora tengchongensis TaxID=1073253 RepID=A0A840P363_9ACTN|nr:TetR/AcrR family transcriptional regulator [Thermocatellispora tengchongensis]MBB5133419.1 AcrR family transcriptional regulator [Thermocatellispora tengchongensis]